ncbi:hypothetical protein Pfo_028477 [Paulownia fortunei]|nr:hypothetical protein Pfo_028477 [Paulownia fortunei]
MEAIPCDLIIEILSRLPVKELGKLSCVCKQWYRLITRNKEFTAQHMKHTKRKPLLLLRKYSSNFFMEVKKNKVTVELTAINMEGTVINKFGTVINGPVHTFVSSGALAILCCMNSLYVFNPSTGEVISVPGSSAAASFYTIGFGYLPRSNEYKIIHLFFVPSVGDGKMGFGYLPVSNEYKIVHMFYHSFVGSGKMGCEIFSFRTGEGVTSGSWRTIGDCPFSAWTDEYPVCVNGIIYWALSSGWKDKSILSLDLEKEEFSSISYPIHESKKYSFLEYIGLMGALCVVGFSAEASTMDIWMLKDKKKKIWAMEYSINLFPLCPKFLIPSDDHSEEILVHMEQRDLICYSLKSGTPGRLDTTGP